jgi:hypothetical protein
MPRENCCSRREQELAVARNSDGRRLGELRHRPILEIGAARRAAVRIHVAAVVRRHRMHVAAASVVSHPRRLNIAKRPDQQEQRGKDGENLFHGEGLDSVALCRVPDSDTCLLIRINCNPGRALAYARLSLLGSNIRRDMRNVVGRQSCDRLHVAKVPVMLSRPVLDRDLERDVGVVRGLIEAVQERRPHLGAAQVDPVTLGACALVERLARTGVRHQARAWLGYPHALGEYLPRSQQGHKR